MKRIGTFVAVAFSSLPAIADPIEGNWRTQEDDGAYAIVSISPCGSAFCGTIDRTFRDGNEYQSENLGRQIVIDMTPDGDGSYAGKVWRPSNSKIYTGKIELRGNEMDLSGCVAGGLICKSQVWTKQ